MAGRGSRVLVVVLAVLLVSILGTGVAAAANEVGAEAGGELLEVSGWEAVALLLVGTAVLLTSIELLIHALVKTAVRFGVSAFLLAVVFSGWEFDNVAFGLFTGFREMQDVAFGLAVGNAVSIFGLTLAVGVLAFPFEVDVPEDYLALLVGAPLLLVPLLVSGTLTLQLSLLFVLLYLVVFAYILRREGEMERTFMQSDVVREATAYPDGRGGAPRYVPGPLRRLSHGAWFWPAMLLVAVGGVVLGAEGSAAGVEGVVDTWNLAGGFAGATFVTILYTFDDLLLIIEPLRLGYEDVAVGGVVGSLLFFVTANVGIIGLVGTLQLQATTVAFHLLALLVFAGLSGLLLRRGRLSRKHGALLFGLYILYLLVNFQAFATVPLGR